MANRTPRHVADILEQVLKPFQSSADSLPVWRESANVWALADSDRHLGHAVRVHDHWIAYDAIHLNPSNDGFRVLGTFTDVDAAKAAIERSITNAWAWNTIAVQSAREVKPGAMATVPLTRKRWARPSHSQKSA